MVGAVGSSAACSLSAYALWACALVALASKGVRPALAAMPPKAKVSELGDIGHGITFEVRPAKAGKPTVHVVVAGARLPAFRLKDGPTAEEQVRCLSHVVEHMARSAAGTSVDADSSVAGGNCSAACSTAMAVDSVVVQLQPMEPPSAVAVTPQVQPPPPVLLPPPPWPFDGWDNGVCCHACGHYGPSARLVRCVGCDALGKSFAYFCDVDCRRRTCCPHIAGCLDRSIECDCDCCVWIDEADEEDFIGGRFAVPFSLLWLNPYPPGQPWWRGRADVPTRLLTTMADASSSNSASYTDYLIVAAASLGGAFGIWGDYEQAMVRAIGRKRRNATWTVEDVVQSMIQAVIGKEAQVNVAHVCQLCEL